MTEFRAFWVEKSESDVSHSVIERQLDDLPDNDTLIKVNWSSLNYKDALSAKGLPGVTRNYPHTPGIDAAGTVVSSKTGDFTEGDEVIVTGYDLGMNTPGGYGQYIRVPSAWVTALPEGMTSRESMVLGTAGLTAALCINKILQMGAAPGDGPVVVTGATGGVGSISVKLLAKLGFEVVASSGKADRIPFLNELGAGTVIGREALAEDNPRPMLATDYAHGVDTVGGVPLVNVIKSLKSGGSVAVCGLVASAAMSLTVLPFLLRGINVLGVDSVEIPLQKKAAMWANLAGSWQLENLDGLVTEVSLDGLSEQIDRIFAGNMVGRVLVNMS